MLLPIAIPSSENQETQGQRKKNRERRLYYVVAALRLACGKKICSQSFQINFQAERELTKCKQPKNNNVPFYSF
jgi:hypothetical protein